MHLQLIIHLGMTPWQMPTHRDYHVKTGSDVFGEQAAQKKESTGLKPRGKWNSHYQGSTRRLQHSAYSNSQGTPIPHFHFLPLHFSTSLALPHSRNFSLQRSNPAGSWWGRWALGALQAARARRKGTESSDSRKGERPTETLSCWQGGQSPTT